MPKDRSQLQTKHVIQTVYFTSEMIVNNYNKRITLPIHEQHAQKQSP